MSTEATWSFRILAWDETSFSELEQGGKLTRVSATQQYEGAFVGESTVEYVMAYANEHTASFVGIERVTGVLDGKAGSFVLQHVGTYEEGRARSSWSILPGCGSAALASLRGEGHFTAASGEPAAVFVRYGFDRT